jgi:protein KTI12
VADKEASLAEKPGRANLFSNLTRNLGPESVVICDSLNYIKGFRYQMYCAAREAHARVCTVSLTSLDALSKVKRG